MEFCRGDPQATLAETNMAAIEIGELKRKMEILKTVVDKLNLVVIMGRWILSIQAGGSGWVERIQFAGLAG